MVSWKTTLIGIVGALATALVPLLQTGSVDLQTLVSAGSLAVLGYFAKDWNVVGKGTETKPPVSNAGLK